jgi:hypothetical protein
MACNCKSPGPGVGGRQRRQYKENFNGAANEVYSLWSQDIVFIREIIPRASCVLRAVGCLPLVFKYITPLLGLYVAPCNFALSRRRRASLYCAPHISRASTFHPPEAYKVGDIGYVIYSHSLCFGLCFVAKNHALQNDFALMEIIQNGVAVRIDMCSVGVGVGSPTFTGCADWGSS